ncbi:hypothetical protein DV515_00017697 [Chloebia gouldiae]|uniref:Laminin EGF-like domain-containing protein n=1 Tax=Chloebia gouldiae TaxID=44316 RepID=A0A3L8QAL8_CHLGU|nr:hypothetical protein DV515_00017698 [Chloebia gouldiae]RLV64003.1 hypothetical protein DV515_00017697 [Chloebia gouldiae]
MECDCDFQGTEEAGCDGATGRCLCRAGATGARCDRCQRGHCGSQGGCQPCHPCFHTYDGDIERLRQRQAGLADGTARLPAGTGGSQLGPRLSRAQGNLQQARGILGHPAGTQQGLAQAGSALAAVREQVQGINPNLHFLDDTASLSRELEALNSSLFVISSQFQSKKSQFESSRSTDLSGAFRTIRSAYQSSGRAGSLAAGAPGLLAEARESRRSAAGLRGHLAGHTAELLALKGELASAPDLTPVINQVKTQSGFLTGPRAAWQGGPAELSTLTCSPAPLPRHGRTKPLSTQTRLGTWPSIPAKITDPTALPSTPSSLSFSLQGLLWHFLYLQDTLNFWMRFLLFLLHCFVIAMETHLGVGCCGDHQPPLAAAGGTSTF